MQIPCFQNLFCILYLQATEVVQASRTAFLNPVLSLDLFVHNVFIHINLFYRLVNRACGTNSVMDRKVT